MSKLLNIVAFAGCCIVSIFLAWLMVDRLGADNVRLGLRYAFAPAVVLAGFAFTMLGKLHDLTEIGNLPVRVIERLIERVSIVQLRLWLLISAVTWPRLPGGSSARLRKVMPPTITGRSQRQFCAWPCCSWRLALRRSICRLCIETTQASGCGRYGIFRTERCARRHWQNCAADVPASETVSRPRQQRSAEPLPACRKAPTCDPPHELAPALAQRLPALHGLAGRRGTA